jgi:hypothetical protein
VVVSCPPLPGIANGSAALYTNGQSIGSIASWACNAGYELVGGALTCQSGGAWSGALPSCQDSNECVELQSPAPGGCDVGAACTNTVGSRICGAYTCHLQTSCVPGAALCPDTPAPDGTSCSDGNACTTGDACLSGSCSGVAVVCPAPDQCHLPGACDPTSGLCSNPPASDGTACNDGNACTQTDTCTSGVCSGSNPIVCPGTDVCHPVGACNPASGTCGVGPVLSATCHCTDGVKDADETNVDCGGVDCGKCLGAVCTAAAQCATDNCGLLHTNPTYYMCGAPNCTDGVKNGAETDVDCGGGSASACPGCAVGRACNVGGDCASFHCVGSVCVAPTCTDGVQNGGESFLDCGGPCPPCLSYQNCYAGTDCYTGVCNSNHCGAQSNCYDGKQDTGESDVDCGGGCNPCAAGKHCNAGTDCQSHSCVSGVCAAPTCSDGFRNNGESAIDCGGATSCPRCATGMGCSTGSDCITGICTAGWCAPSPVNRCLGVVCVAIDGCHAVGVCDPIAGECVNAPLSDGTACTIGGGPGTCIGGVCVSHTGP